MYYAIKIFYLGPGLGAIIVKQAHFWSQSHFIKRIYCGKLRLSPKVRSSKFYVKNEIETKSKLVKFYGKNEIEAKKELV